MTKHHNNPRVPVTYIADETSYSTATIYHWYRAGLLPPLAPPRRKEWFKNDIDTWINDNFTTGDTE